MVQFNIKWAAPIVVAIVLAVALLAAASTGMFKGASTTASEELAPGGGPAGALQRPTTNFGPRVDAGGDPNADSGAEPTRTPVTGSASDDAVTRRPLTRADLALLLTEAFAFQPAGILMFTDVEGHPAQHAIAAVTAAGVMDGHFDGTFRPLQPVTRAEVATAVVRALGLDDFAVAHVYDEPVFRDVPVEHHAYAAVSMAHRLGLYPFHVGGLFAPDEPVQMAEARQMIQAAAALERIEGPIAYINAPARTLSVQEDERRAISFVFGESSLIVRNDAVVDAEALRPGDEVHVYADATGELLIAAAAGPGSNSSTVVDEAVKVLRELATPEQLAAIIARDWDQAGAELRKSVHQQLLDNGLTEEEAAALLAQDWDTVEEHGKQRLTELVSGSADVEPELVRAVLDQDWDTAMSHIEVEVLEYVLNYLMETEQA